MPLQFVRQDITKMNVDAIVNTTNEQLVGYSGVDLAVHTAAGPELDAECARLAPLGLGQAKITRAYRLGAKYVIHTSGPVWHGGFAGESIILRSCYLESLKLAVSHGCRSVAFPLISSGAYGYPKDQALKFAVATVTEFLLENEIDVYLCVFDNDSYAFSRKLSDDIEDFIEGDFSDIDAEYREYSLREMRCSLSEPMASDVCYLRNSASDFAEESLEDYLKFMDKPFAYRLFDLIDERGMTDVECYKRANVNKRTFSKIRANAKTYKPSKQTAVAFAIALKLSLEQTQELLASAGLTLSCGLVFDKIIIYFLKRGVYDIFEINEALFEFDQPLLGSL